MAKSIISIVKGTNPDEMVEKALDYLGGIKTVIKPNSTVVIKPNAGHMGPPDSSINTNPAVVSAVIKAVKKANPEKIILRNHRPWDATPWIAWKSAELKKRPSMQG
jgi:uncharacterized protein (DUF362 family)